MQILSIQLKNIKSHRELELDFAPGINVLSGANGVGKSTIFEAIGYALFGVDAQSFVGNVERFISIGARRGEIAVTFQIDEELYRVSRSVGTPSRWLLARQVGGDFEVEEHKDARETETRLSELLGLDNGRPLAEQFELVIGPFQNEFLGPFVERRPTTRRNKFDQILGIDSWRRTFSETGGLQKALQNRIAVLESAIGPLREQVAALPEKRALQRTAGTDLKATRQELQSRQRELDGLTRQLAEFDKREQTVKELGVEIDKLSSRLIDGQAKLTSQQTLIGEAEKSQQIVDANAAGKQACDKAEQRLAKLREKLTLQRRLEQAAAELDKQAGSLVARHAAEVQAIEQVGRELHDEEQTLEEKCRALTVDPALQTLAVRLPELRKRIDELRAASGQLAGRRDGLEEGNQKLAEGICPFFQEPCLNIAENPPADVFSARFAELDDQRQRLAGELARLEHEEAEAAAAADKLRRFEIQLKGLDEQATNLAARRSSNQARTTGLDKLRQEISAARQRLAEKQQELEAFSSLQAEIAAAEAEQQQHRTARDLYVAHLTQAEKLAGRRAELEKYQALFARLQGELATLKASYAAANQEYDPARHQSLRRQKDEFAREVGALGQKLQGLEAEVQRLDTEIDKLRRLEQEIAEKQARIKQDKDKETLVKFLRNRVFNKVSAQLSERLREEISQRANAIYRVIAEADEELAWGEDYRILLHDLVDGKLRERTDDQLSGGQTMSAVVALRLALLQTIGARIAFFDEPTSNLDAARRENLARAFRAIDIGKEEVTEHWYDQLFLISHDVAFTEITDQLIELAPPEIS